MLFISPQKLFSFLRYFHLCLDFLVMRWKGLIKKIKVNFKFYDVTAWLTNNRNTHIVQYFEMFDFVSHICLQWFSVLCICNSDLLDFNKNAAEPCCSIEFSCAFSWLWANQSFLNFQFWFCYYCTLFVQCQVEVFLHCVYHIRFKCCFFWPWENRYIVHGFDSISITQFSAMICSVSAEGCLNHVPHLI